MTNLEHLLHLEKRAGHVFFGCNFPRHLWHFWSGFFSLELSEGFSLDLSCDFSLKFPLFLRDFPFAMPSTCAGVDLNPPSRMFCCCFTVSLCLAKFVAFSRVRFGSSWSFSESSRFCNPTTIRSRMSSSFSAPKLQYLARPYKSVIKLSTDSPTRLLLELNFARSKMIFLFAMK